MIMNAMRGTLKVAAIKAPHYGEERRNILEDLAISTGATFITRESGIKLKDVKMQHLGSAKRIESTQVTTTIIGGAGNYEEIDARIESLKELIKVTDSMQACERHQGRLVRLASGVAVIRVGGTTEVEMIEKKHRIEDALEAVRSAQEEGIIPGGGSALLRASRSLAITTDSAQQALGATIVQRACQAPIVQMAKNAGESSDLIIDSVLKSKQAMGWDFRANEMVNLYDRGVVDPVKVTVTALRNAASCAGTLITTNFGIIQTE